MYLENVRWEGIYDYTDENIEILSKEISEDERGVYLIWSVRVYEDNPMVYVGQGKLVARLKAHLDENDRVMQSGFRNLVFAYTILPKQYCKGVENYMGYLYQPEVKSDYMEEEDEDAEKYYFPNVRPIEVGQYPITKYSPQLVGTAYPAETTDWDDYFQAFCDWAEEQHGKGYVEPRKGRISLPTKQN